MSTSLKEQLQKLAVPQTIALIDRKRRVSILFDTKEAATKDRRTIYELGISGLQELISLNADFKQFELTLFDETTLDLERAVEQNEVNELLNRNIRKFLQHLSPYFLLRPSHLCLEWLLRRFEVHSYNRNDLIALALPYHETNIFVKVLQVAYLGDAEWEWLRPLKKPGLPLPKSALINRASTHAGFLAFICRATVNILREFGLRAHLLQTQINFFTTVVVGAFEIVSEFKEWHISTILESLLYTLSAKNLDVAASGYIIAAQLVTRTQLKIKLCKVLLERVMAVSFEELRPSAVMLIILIFDVQESAPKQFSQKSLNIILGQKWLIPIMAALAKQKIEIFPLCAPLLRDALSAIESGHEDADTFKRLAMQMLNDLDFSNPTACQVINCFLDCYVQEEPVAPKPSLEDGDVIDLESDDDEIDTAKPAFKAWYSDYLRRLEQKYPIAFDATIKEALSAKTEGSENRKMALKIALGYRLKISNATTTDIYESLYHHNANIRQIAMQTLVTNLSNYQSRFQNFELLKACLADRLLDDSRLVVAELLKLSSKDFIEALGYEQFANGLLSILHKIQTRENWTKLTPHVVRHLTSSQLLANYDTNLILLALMPLLFPNEKNYAYNTAVEEMQKSELVKKFPFLKQLRGSLANQSNPNDARKRFLDLFADDGNELNLPTPNKVFESVEKQGQGYFKQASQLSNFLILLTVSFRTEQTAAESLHMFETVEQYLKIFQLKQMDTLQKANWEEAISLQLFTDFLQALMRYTSFKNLLTWYKIPFTENMDLVFFLRVFELIAGKAFAAKKPEEMAIWSNTLIQCFEAVCPSTQQKVDLLINFYLDTENVENKYCSPSVRLMAFKVLNSLIGSKKNDFLLNLTHLLKISSSFVSSHETIRSVALETMEIINKNFTDLDKNLQYFVQSILEYTPEISMDKEQYPLMLYVILKSPEKRTDHPKAARILNDILQLLNKNQPSQDEIVFQAQLLSTLKHFNDEEILIALIPLAIQSLENITPELNGTPALLPAPYNRSFYSIVQRFQASTIEQVVTDCEDTWRLFENVFEKFNVYMTVEERELQPLPCVLLDSLDMHIYDKLPTKYQFELLKLILRTEAQAQNDTISLSAHKLLKNCIVDCKPLVGILQKMYTTNESEEKTPGKKLPAGKQSKRNSDVVQQKLIVETNSLAWKEGVALLELLEHKEKLDNAEQLIPALFDLLKFCLQLDEQSGVGAEYTKQLTLSLLLHCCRYAKTRNINLQQAFPKATFRIDQIVQCVRATQNPQTHQNALTLLAHCATQFPQQVLHNIVDIFTFMGSSVVRHDDAFSFHIIDNIIESIIPILVQTEKSSNIQNSSVMPVLKVFSDIMLDVPEHRRISLYTKLLTTLGVSEHYWRFLCTVFEAQVADEEKQRQIQKKSKTDTQQQTKRMEIIMELSNGFAPQLVLETCTQLLNYLKNILPLTKEHESLSDLEADDNTSIKSKRKSISKSPTDAEVEVFSVQHHSSRQLRHFKYIIMQYLSGISKAPEFLRKIAVLTDTETLEMKPFFQNFIISILAYIPIVNATVERFDEPSQVKFWKVILHHLHDVLDNAISLLSPDMFLVVIIGLMQHQLLSVRKKVIELLITKLQQLDEDSDFLVSITEQRFTEIIQPLSDIIAGILNKQQQQQQDESVSPASPSSSSANELIFLQQTALIAVKLLSKHFALKYISEFKAVLANLTKIVKCRGNISKIVFATVVLALIEISSNLKAHSLEQLPKFMPQLIELLNHQADVVRQQPPDHVCIAIITGTHKLFESLPRFLGPYIVDIITALSSISTRIAAQQGTKDQRSIVALNKISLIWTKIASEVYVRILVPSCEKSYKNLMSSQCYDEIKEIMKLLRESIDRASNEDLAPVQTDLRNFFLHVLEFRMETKQNEVINREQVIAIELTIIDAFVAYVLKLSESAFRPLYEKVYDWALKEVAQPESQLTYFLVSSRIGDALRSLFVLFAGKFLEDAGNLLNTCNTSKQQPILPGEDEYIQLELLKALLSTLHSVFLHANKKFINIQRFEMLLPKIIDQLENRLVLENEDVQQQLVACIAQLAVVVSNDMMWKQLNYQVLLKTRTSVPEVRILSFNCCVEIARKLGDEFTSLLPETVPFIAELFEDENSRVEKNTRKAVQELEGILGESLQKYL